MEIGPRFPGSDDAIASGKITIARARKLKRNVKCKSRTPTNDIVEGSFHVSDSRLSNTVARRIRLFSFKTEPVMFCKSYLPCLEFW